MELCCDILVSPLNISAVVGQPVWEAEAEAHNFPKLVPLFYQMTTLGIWILIAPQMCQRHPKRRKSWIPKNRAVSPARSVALVVIPDIVETTVVLVAVVERALICLPHFL